MNLTKLKIPNHINLETIKKFMGWCPDVNKTKRETRFVEYETASIDAGMPVKKWKFDLIILGHICALLFASLFLLPVSTNQALNVYTSPYLLQNYGSLLADITLSIASALFSSATVMLIYNIAMYKKLYLKYCYFNVVLLSGLFVAITLQFFLLIGGYMLERAIYWAFIFALPISIPSLLSIKLDNIYSGQKIIKDGNGLAAIIKRSMGWRRSEETLNKTGEAYIVSCEWKYLDKIKAIGFREVLGILHLVFAIGLIITALMVLAKPTIFPWWNMDINIISSGLLLAVGITSLVIFFGFIKAANIRILALVNIALLAVFSLYLSQFLLSPYTYNSTLNVPSLDKPFNNYGFVLETLMRFTLIIGMPSILTFFIKPAEEKKRGFLIATLLILLVVFASLGAYYLYLNKQKDSMLAEVSGKNGEYKLYRAEPNALWLWGGYPYYPYYLDSPGDTTGHPISKDTYEAIQFLRTKEEGKVLSWWDLELEIKAAKKEPVISYASEATKFTIGRFASLYTEFEPDEKVADVSRFFTTDSEDAAKNIAEKYGANIVYIPKERMPGDIFISMFMGANGIIYQGFSSGVLIPTDFEKRVYEPSMAYKFNSGAELKYFEKIFENKDVYIYQLKK